MKADGPPSLPRDFAPPHERSGLLAGGNWVVDRIKTVDVYPAQDALANILSESVGNGGSPFNILVDLARLGVTFPLEGVGLVGADADGEWIVEECHRRGIGTCQLRRHPHAPTSYTDVMTVQSTGRRTFFHQRGANAFLDDADFDFLTGAPRIFHLGYLLLLDRLDESDLQFGTRAARLLARARDAGCLTSIELVSEDSQRFSGIIRPALPHVDFCILNEFEAARTTGRVTRTDTGPDLPGLEAACGDLLDSGVHRWVIVHFPEGACAMGPDRHLHLQGSLRLPQAAIAGAVGAGDAFAAGVLCRLHDRAPIREALQTGVCVAAACLRATGASDGVSSLAECLALEAEFGCRTLS